MKKIIAVILCFAMMIPFVTLAASATEVKQDVSENVKITDSMQQLNDAFAEDQNSLIVFVTGIGQSWSYLFDESYLAKDAFESGTLHDYENYSELIANDKYIARWNLFNNYFDEALKDPETLKALVGAVLQLLFGMFTRKNMVSDENVDTIVQKLLAFNIVDENGKCNERVVTPRYTIPLSEYPGAVNQNGVYESEAKNRFYNSIPCAEICKEKLGENYEDYIYCYNYCAFSYTSDNVKGLHDFVEEILKTNKVGAEKVVLVPMSMGASVVSAYLAAYPDAADNYVRRVVSIVGCWDGSDIVYDLLTQSYADNSADLFYNGLLSDIIGEPWGYVVNFVLRFFSKQALRDFIDQALVSISNNILLRTPSLMALVPSARYEKIRPMIKSEKVLAETDKYYQAQSTIKDRLAALEQQGITFSFIAGYGLPYGAITSDYTAFGFMNHSERTNSDEIIDISSTAPGTSYVPYTQTYTDTQGKELSPDKTIDISTTYYKDSTWFFYGQKHELEYNNTAISVAIELALGKIKTVDDCDDLEEDGVYYPQFNGARNLKSLKKSYIPDLNSYCKLNNYILNEEQQALYNEVIDMTNNHVNNYEKDNALIEEFRLMLVDMGIYSEDAEESWFDTFFNDSLKKGNDITYKIFGAKGFIDLPQKQK